VLCSGGDELAERVAAEDLGEVVPPGDLDALVGAIGRLRDPARRAACGARARVAGAAQAWDSVAGPLVEYCADPWREPDLVDRPASTRSAGSLRRLFAQRR
jgi:hypothetical protein